jgi:hypothetical protein
MATQNKTVANDASVQSFIDGVEHKVRRADAQVLLAEFSRITGWPAQMWGPSIIGFGRYEYKYESGREGDSLVVGFSPRKASTSVYIMPGYRDMSEKLDRLGKHKIGKSCLYINKLADVDLAVLEEIIRDGVAYMKANYTVTDK